MPYNTSISIQEGTVSISPYAFKNCYNLSSITIPTSITSIGTGAFSNCISLTSITIPNSVTSIGNFAFSFCSGLTSVTIPSSVTSIGDFVYACSGLISITIGSGVTSIGEYAFEGCSGIDTIICNAITPPTIYYNTFLDVNTATPIFVPCSSLSDYTNDTLWIDFTNIIGVAYTTIDTTIHQGESYFFAGQTLTTTGVYYDTLQTASGCDSIVTLNLTAESSLNSIEESTLTAILYPNPAKEQTTLKVSGLKNKAEVTVYDMQGRSIARYAMAAESESLTIDCSKLAKGVYNVRIETKDNYITKKLIVQ